MTRMEILHTIVTSEQEARGNYAEALRKREGFDEYIAQKEQTLRQEAFEKADKKLFELETSEKKKTDSELAELDKKHGKDMAAAQKWYDDKRESIVERVFELVVNADV